MMMMMIKYYEMEKCCANCKYWTDRPNPDSQHTIDPVNFRFKFCYVEAGVKEWREEVDRTGNAGNMISGTVIHFRGDYGRNCSLFQPNAQGQLTIFSNDSSVLHTR
jgi:hypothetical protein